MGCGHFFFSQGLELQTTGARLQGPVLCVIVEVSRKTVAITKPGPIFECTALSTSVRQGATGLGNNCSTAHNVWVANQRAGPWPICPSYTRRQRLTPHDTFQTQDLQHSQVLELVYSLFGLGQPSVRDSGRLCQSAAAQTSHSKRTDNELLGVSIKVGPPSSWQTSPAHGAPQRLTFTVTRPVSCD